MNRYLISAAALALFAAPAFAQHDDHRDHPGGGEPHAEAPHPAPAAPAAAAPHAAGGAPRGDAHGGPRGDGGFHRDTPRPAAPVAAPAAPAAAPAQQRGDFNRGNRQDFRNGNAAPTNRSSSNGGNGGARNFSGFRDFHRTFNAQHRFRAPAYSRPSGWSYRRWSYGETLPALFWAQQYWLNDFSSYDLPPPPPGAVWVRYGDDALLIDRYSGEIITVEYSVFY